MKHFYITLLLVLAIFKIAQAQVELDRGRAVSHNNYSYKRKANTSENIPLLNNSPYSTELNCNDWLSTPTNQSAVTIGDADVMGNTITVEALFNRSTAFNPSFQFGKLVYKGSGPSDLNYSLMPVTCEITTTNGYVTTPVPCTPLFDRVYHVAMVYDGTILKFYRNGFLMSSVNWSGNLVTNNLDAFIGDGNQGAAFQHFGYTNEVRIWNTARTQSQIRANMNSSLPNPTTTPGLVAYYTFDNLQNKQGNAAYNGTLNGSATINATNPNCNFVADSCGQIPSGIEEIINLYTPVLAFDPCKNQLTVENANGYNVGDTVLMIQMKGAVIDSSNTAAFGTVTDYKSAGNYEFNYILAKTGNLVTLKNKLLRTYEIPAGKVQLIRVPYYNNIIVSNTLTCDPWDGSKGGVLVFNVKDTVTLNAGINVKGKGFRGGSISNNPDGACGTGSPDYFYPLTQPGSSWNAGGAEKGEGIANFLSPAKMAGKGALGSGGGGGNKHNTGGGGGSNFGTGGKGGNTLAGCPGATNGGLGGVALTTAINNGKLFLGGGGGCGDINNNVGTKGVEGGGIVIVQCDYLRGNNNTIDVDGNSQLLNGTGIADGAGGGGGGGTVLLSVNNHTGSLTINSRGGNGGNQTPSFGCVGPGGGGGGGLVYLKQAAAPASFTINTAGGAAGIFQATGFSCSNTTYGAAPGTNGGTLFNLTLPVSNAIFKPNIDSVRIKDSATSCLSFSFKGFGYTNSTPIQRWQWYFGDGGTDNVQNTSHTYTSGSTFTVKLVVTDANGCKDSISKPVTTTLFTATANGPIAICKDDSAQLNVTAPGAISYSWSPALYLSNTGIASPKAWPPVTTKYYITALSTLGCTAKDSVTVTVRPQPVFNMVANKPVICEEDSVQFIATGGDNYLWSPGYLLSDSTIRNPAGYPDGTTLFQVRIIESVCKDTAFFSKLITVNPLPEITAAKTNDINCARLSSQLSAPGGLAYTWLPATGLSNPNIANPIVTIDSTITYLVQGTNSFGCTGSDTVTVAVTKDGKGFFELPGAFTPNGDGLNDCFGIQGWGKVNIINFAVYNRWGERVWSTTNPNDCWNGFYKGVKQPGAAYVYYIRANSFCGPVFRKGTVILIR
jgi:gliding motility-associated-like protein